MPLPLFVIVKFKPFSLPVSEEIEERGRGGEEWGGGKGKGNGGGREEGGRGGGEDNNVAVAVNRITSHFIRLCSTIFFIIAVMYCSQVHSWIVEKNKMYFLKIICKLITCFSYLIIYHGDVSIPWILMVAYYPIGCH